MPQMSQKRPVYSIDQQRAQSAREFILAFVKEFQNDKKALSEFRSYCRNNPSVILYNGLGNAVAFYNSKAPYDSLVKALTHWARTFLSKGLDFNLEHFIVHEADTFAVAYLTQEIIAFSIWLKRFSEIHIEDNFPMGVVD